MIIQDIKGQYTLFVKPEFLDVCPNPQNYTGYELCNKFQVWRFLHNTQGPAVINRNPIKNPFPNGWGNWQVHNGTMTEWWENGEPLKPAQRLAREKEISNE